MNYPLRRPDLDVRAVGTDIHGQTQNLTYLPVRCFVLRQQILVCVLKHLQ